MLSLFVSTKLCLYEIVVPSIRPPGTSIANVELLMTMGEGWGEASCFQPKRSAYKFLQVIKLLTSNLIESRFCSVILCYFLKVQRYQLSTGGPL